MRKVTCLLLVPFFLLLSFSCKKKKVEEKADGLWYVTRLENKYYSDEHIGTCEFNSGGTGAFDISFYNVLSGMQVINKDSFTWTNTKNTITIKFDSTGERLYFKIEHLSKKQLELKSGDYTYGVLMLNRD